MRRQDASNAVKRRLKYSKCPLCNHKIDECDDFQYLKYPVSRYMVYAFFHTSCLKNANSVPLQEEEVSYEEEKVQVG